MPEQNVIRRDIYSVKVWDHTVDAYCHLFMTFNRKLAFSRLRDERQQDKRAKLVHPAQWVVDYYVAVGNKIAA